MSVLETIVSELQHIVGAMNAAANIDITIVDDRLFRLAGTGPLSGEVGKPAPENSAYTRCLQTGEQYFIQYPREDSVCTECVGRESCTELAELCIPIKMGETTIGVLGMCAFSEEARRSFIDNHEGYARFETQLSGLIVSMLNERKFGILAEYRSSELETVINSLSEGIMILSASRQVAAINRWLAARLGADPADPPPARELIPPKLYEQLVDRRFSGEFGPVRIRECEYIVSASPVIIKSEPDGAVLVFSDFAKMRKSVHSAERRRSQVTFADIVGESEALSGARGKAMQIAAQDVSVMLVGETGTGKEIFAHAIHAASRRRGDVFMPVNCGAIPEALIESELFGYAKGAFTGAGAAGKPGLFEICRNGTLFLDEIGDLPFPMQVKLLRALEEKEIMRVGGTSMLRVNPRIISASHMDLSAMAAQKSFREDLFYRLNVVPIVIPPLRERGGDVILLARYFLEKYTAVYEKDISGFTPECERLLMRHSYPGNIRELRNLIEYAVIFEPDHLISADSVAQKLNERSAPKATLAELTRDFERSVIERQLARTGSSLDAKREVAESLGISLATLYRRLEESAAGERKETAD